jgi:hypothetical protein
MHRPDQPGSSLSLIPVASNCPTVAVVEVGGLESSSLIEFFTHSLSELAILVKVGA